MNLLELFKGTGSVGKVANKLGFNVISIDLDPIYTPDIETDILKWDYKGFHKKYKYVPDYIWASPPCNTFSPLVYPLKERNTETAEPYSKRAKLGTRILHKTLTIINYFKKLNPKLLFCIENPRGMMRHDKKITKLYLSNTLYCLYGDNKRKSTDFFSNYPLELNQSKSCGNRKVMGVLDMNNIEDRYRIPPRLIKTILQQSSLVI